MMTTMTTMRRIMKTLKIYWKHLLSLNRMSRRRQTVARPSSLCYDLNEDDYADFGDCSSEIGCCDSDEINSNMAPFYRCYYCYMTMVAEIRMD